MPNLQSLIDSLDLQALINHIDDMKAEMKTITDDPYCRRRDRRYFAGMEAGLLSVEDEVRRLMAARAADAA